MNISNFVCATLLVLWFASASIYLLIRWRRARPGSDDRRKNIVVMVLNSGVLAVILFGITRDLVYPPDQRTFSIRGFDVVCDSVPPSVKYAKDFREGLAAICIDSKWGFIDANGVVVIAPQFDDVEDGFSEGLAAVKVNDKWGYIDRAGNTICDYIYNLASPFHDSRGCVAIRGPDNVLKYGYVAPDGRVTIPINFEWATNFREGVAAVTRGGKAGYIDPNNSIVIPLIYKMAHEFSEGLAGVRLKDGTWAFINHKGQVTVGPLPFADSVGWYHDGLASFRSGSGYYTVAHRLGPVKSTEVKWSGGQTGFIDKHGQPIIGPVDFPPSLGSGMFSEGLALVQRKLTVALRSGYIDTTGRLVIPCKFYNATPFSEGYARVTTCSLLFGKSEYRLIDRKGRYLSPKYVNVLSTVGEGYIIVQYRDKVYLFRVSGRG